MEGKGKRMRRTRWSSFAKAIAALVLNAPFAAAPLQAAEANCGNGLFQGSYVLSVDGVVYNAYGPSIHGPVTRLGYMHAKGDGTFEVPSLASYAGFPAAVPSRDGWQPEDANGTYSIGPDCSLLLTVGAPPPLSIPVTFKGSITRDGKHLSFLQYNPAGTTVKATAERINPSCNWQDITGDWSVEMRGTIMPPFAIPVGPPLGTLNVGLPDVFGDYSMVGQINLAQPNFAGDESWSGDVTGNTTVAYGGLFAAIELGPNPPLPPVARLENEQWIGRYQVLRDCTVRVRYITTMEAAPRVFVPVQLSWWGVLKQDGSSREMRFIMSELPIGPMLGKAWPVRPAYRRGE